MIRRLFKKPEVGVMPATSGRTLHEITPVLPSPERPLSAKVLEQECRIRELLREPHLYDRFFLPIVKEFYSLCWGFPASDGNHHPGRLGLIEHSLGVVLRMLREAPLVRDGITGRQRDTFVLHCLLAGLGHDLGKTLEWMVDSRGYDYSPLGGSIRDQGFSCISHSNTGKHAVLSTLVFNRLLSACPAFLYGNLFNPRQLAATLDAILLHHEDPTEGEIGKNPYLPLLRKADREDAAEDMIVVPSEAELSAREETIIREREAVRVQQVEIAVRAIKLVLAHAKYGDGWYVTENGWLLVVSPRWTDQEGQGIYQEYTRLLGREVRPYDLWTSLKEAGAMLSLEGKNSDFPQLRIVRSGDSRVKSLYFACFNAEAILSPDDRDGLEKYVVKGLAKVLQCALFKERGENENVEDTDKYGVACGEINVEGSASQGVECTAISAE